jgi:hypothetical protein
VIQILHALATLQELPSCVAEAAKICGSSRYFINLTLEKALLTEYAPNSEGTLGFEAKGRTLGGRVFGPDAECRWQQNRDEFDFWMMKEVPDTMVIAPLALNLPDARVDQETLSVLKAAYEQKYFCIGRWRANPAPGAFYEGRFPNPIVYPEAGSTKNDRFFFRVREYRPWPSTGLADPVSLTNALNQPRVLAYRLIGVGVDEGDPIEVPGASHHD